MYTTLVAAATLAAHLDDPAWLCIDCRFQLASPEAGEQAYLESHIPGAVYAHLERDLSGPPDTDAGRHPLPPAERLVALFSQLGIHPDSQVVAYDDAGGAIAARLWWMLRYMGHSAVAVLDGGWTAWEQAGYPLSEGWETNAAVKFSGQARRDRLVVAEEIPAVSLLVDSRTPERYRGEQEPLDSKAGHIPGAVNRAYGNNLTESGHFRPAEELNAAFTALLGEHLAEEAVYYCGSGVTACHNLLAHMHAGLPEGRLYAGSWSDWICDPRRPIAEGPSD